MARVASMLVRAARYSAAASRAASSAAAGGGPVRGGCSIAAAAFLPRRGFAGEASSSEHLWLGDAAHHAAAPRRLGVDSINENNSLADQHGSHDLATDEEFVAELADEEFVVELADEEFDAEVSDDKFVVEEEDMDSSEAMWAHYERWCEHFKEKRDRDEMERRFPRFVDTVRLVNRVNSSNLSYRLEINEFADGKKSELRHGIRYSKEDIARCKAMQGRTSRQPPATRRQ